MNYREYLAARIALGIVNAYEIQDDVNFLIKNGVFYNEFIDIIDSQPPTLADVLVPYKKFLIKLNIAIPSKEDAIWKLIDFHTWRIINNDFVVFDSLYWLYRDVFDFSSDNLGEAFGIDSLLGSYYLYEDILDEWIPISGENALSKWEKDVVKEANNWRKKYLDECPLCKECLSIHQQSINELLNCMYDFISKNGAAKYFEKWRRARCLKFFKEVENANISSKQDREM